MSEFTFNTSTKVDTVGTGFSFRPISPSAFTLKPIDIVKNKKSNLKFNMPLFKFGNHPRGAEKYSETKFNFVFDTNKSDKSNAVATFKEEKLQLNNKTEAKVITESTTDGLNESSTISIMDCKDLDEHKEEFAEFAEKQHKEVNIKVLFQKYKEILEEFSKERSEYERRFAALETRIESLESNLIKASKNSDAHSTNNTENTLLSVQPETLPSFVPPQTNIFGSTPLFSSASVQTPANFVFGASTFLNKTSDFKLDMKNIQLNKPTSYFLSALNTNPSSDKVNEIANSQNNTTREKDSDFESPDSQMTTETFANEENESFIKSENENDENIKELNLKEQNSQNIEETLDLDNLKKSLEECFEKATRDILNQLKSVLENRYNKNRENEKS